MKTLTFGAKLDLFLRERDLTNGALSRKTAGKVPEKNIERYRAGQNAPSAAHLVRILKTLDVSLDAIDPGDLE